MKKHFVFALVAVLTVAMTAGVAHAKGKPAGKEKPTQKKDLVVTYVFKGEVASIGADSALVSVEKGNKFARSYSGQQVDFAVDGNTKIVEDDVEASLSDLEAGDRAVVHLKAPKSGVASFVATKIIAESPQAYYLDADGDGIGTGDSVHYFAGEEPEGYVNEGGDNCADVSNSDQADSDGDGIGDACDEPAPSV
jgi:hypothetical protein